MKTQDNLITHENSRVPVSERKVYSNSALIIALVVVLGVTVQFAMSFALSGSNLLEDQTLALIIVSFVSIYVIALPVGALLLRRGAAASDGYEQFGIGKIIGFILMGEALSFIGNILGTVLAMALSGGNAVNPVTMVATGEGHTLIKIVCMVLIAPLLEELVFRKLIIDRTRKFDEKTAVVFSALLFALYHVNLYQFFYTLAIGLLWAYVYLRTGKIWYSYIMHVFLNFKGMIVAGRVMSASQFDRIAELETPEEIMTLVEQNPEIAGGILVFALYALCNLVLAIIGIVLLVRNRKKWVFVGSSTPGHTGRINKKMLFNAGTLIFAAICVAIMALQMFVGG